MTTEVIVCGIADPLSRVYELMDTNATRHVLVVDDAGLCGIINTSDVVKHRLGEIDAEANALKAYVSS